MKNRRYLSKCYDINPLVYFLKPHIHAYKMIKWLTIGQKVIIKHAL